MAIRPDQVKPGVRVRVLRNNVFARRPRVSSEDDRLLRPDDVVTLSGEIHSYPDGRFDVAYWVHQDSGYKNFLPGYDLELIEPESEIEAVSDSGSTPAEDSLSRAIRGHHPAIALPIVAARVDHLAASLEATQARCSAAGAGNAKLRTEVAELRVQIAEMTPRLLPEGPLVTGDNIWPGAMPRYPIADKEKPANDDPPGYREWSQDQ